MICLIGIASLDTPGNDCLWRFLDPPALTENVKESHSTTREEGVTNATTEMLDLRTRLTETATCHQIDGAEGTSTERDMERK
jgi:hypothetical protein